MSLANDRITENDKEIRKIQDKYSKHRGKELVDLFKEGLDLFNKISNSQSPTNSEEVQRDVRGTIEIFEFCTILVSLGEVFSRNEGIEEVATNDLQYFLLPALLGSLNLKKTSGERRHIVDVAEVYFKDFLRRCNDYGLSNYVCKEKADDDNNGQERKENSEFEMLAAAVNTRATKIQRYKEQKELKERLEDLKKNMENETVDEEIKRNYFLTMIKLYIHESIDELSSIEMEKPILQHMAKMKEEKPLHSARQIPPPAPLKAIVITKDMLQKQEYQSKVFGTGYPSLPTLTVGEFYEKRVADGWFPDPNKKKSGPLSMQEAGLAGISVTNEDKEAEEQEHMEERDDDDYIKKMRDRDEFKDTHRRGWGNRMNRS